MFLFPPEMNVSLFSSFLLSEFAILTYLEQLACSQLKVVDASSVSGKKKGEGGGGE